MKTSKHEMFSVEMTNQELEDLIHAHILAKYPFLKDEDTWSWEDFSIDFNYREREKVAVFSMWSKNEKQDAQSILNNCKQTCCGSCNRVDPFDAVCR